MIKIFDSPEYMTVEEVKEKFYPCRVVLANCEISYHAPIAGYTMAMETMPDDDYSELFKFMKGLLGKHEEYGSVHMILTRKPLEGEWLCVEFAQSDKVRT